MWPLHLFTLIEFMTAAIRLIFLTYLNQAAAFRVEIAAEWSKILLRLLAVVKEIADRLVKVAACTVEIFFEFVEIPTELTLIPAELVDTLALLVEMFLELVLTLAELVLILLMLFEMAIVTEFSRVAPPGRLPIATD